MKEERKIVILLFVCIWTLAFNIQQAESSDPSQVEWARTYGGTDHDWADCVVQTSDGGYVLAGTTWSVDFVNLLSEAWLVKIDPNGNVQWDQTYGGPGSDLAHWIVQTSDGGYVLTGSTNSFGAGERDFWLVKADPNGDVQWSKTYGGADHDVAWHFVQTSDGGYALAGRTKSFGAGDYDFWLVKTDSSGNEQWNRTYGGTGEDGSSCVVETFDGGYALVGYTDSFGAGYPNVWLVKVDSSGNEQWNKTYGGDERDIGRSVVQAHDGGYALAGYTASFGEVFWDFWLVKVDPNGNMEWDKTYGGSGNTDDATCIVQTSDTGYALAGYTYCFGAGQSDFWLVKVDSSGNEQWNKTYGGVSYELAECVVQTSDGGYALAGETRSFGAGGEDFWLVKVGEIAGPTYVLTIPPSEGGATTPSPGMHTYWDGIPVWVTAIPETCYVFDHWQLDGNDVDANNPYSIVMDSNHVLEAVFVQQGPYDLTIEPASGGTTEPVPGTHSYGCGSYVDVNAIPDECYEFDHWELDGGKVGSANPYSVHMDNNHTLEAVFVQLEYDLTITATSGGTTDPTPRTYSYGCDSVVDINAIPDERYEFDHWELDGNDVGSTNPYSVLMDRARTLHAVFFLAQASVPSPADGAEDVASAVVLSWKPGAFTADVNGHDVYFGTNFNDVNDANSSWPPATDPNDPNVYKGRQDPNRYPIIGALDLDLGKTFYWRIDEVNDPCVWKGNVWEFTINHIVLDDFEDYNDVANPLRDTWLDGLYNLTGSWVELGIDPCEPMHGGKQSMIYDYNNSYDQGAGYYSEIEAATTDLGIGSDWDGLGTKAFVLYFYGAPNNDANDTEQMYVGLADSLSNYGEVRYGDYGEDINDIKSAEWQEWKINMQDFNDAGVDVNDVNKVYIGFGDRGNQTVPGGVGVVYFDDIRLYVRYGPAGDINRDGVVDFEDLEIMCDEWLVQSGQLDADLYKDEDNRVNFKDFAVLANGWLEGQL